MDLLQTTQIMLEHRTLAELHQRPNGCWRSVELGDLVFVNDAPVPIVAGEEGSSFELQTQ